MSAKQSLSNKSNFSWETKCFSTASGIFPISKNFLHLLVASILSVLVSYKIKKKISKTKKLSFILLVSEYNLEK